MVRGGPLTTCWYWPLALIEASCTPVTPTLVTRGLLAGLYINKPANNPRVTSVGVTGVQLASISANGQYQQVVSGPPRTIKFSLTKVNGQWRITDPPNQLLLSNSEFHRVYQPRNLYYFDSTSR